MTQTIISKLPKVRSAVPINYTGVISDKVLIKGVPSKRKVCLYHRDTNKLVKSTWSDHSGNYQFQDLSLRDDYYVLAVDHTRNYNAVIQDMIRAD